jgi:hypothetical protein
MVRESLPGVGWQPIGRSSMDSNDERMLPLEWTARGKKKAGHWSLVFSGSDGRSPFFPVVRKRRTGIAPRSLRLLSLNLWRERKINRPPP